MRTTDLLPLWAVVQRELVATLRRGSAYVLTAALVLCGVLLASAFWPPDGALPLHLGQLSSAFLYYASFALSLATVFVIPGIAGSSIVIERRCDTIDSLAMTFAHPWHVLTAKTIASLGVFLLMTCAMCPVLAVAYFTVGVDPEVLVNALAVIAISALLSAAAGIYCSCVFRQPSIAIAASYIIAWTLYGLPYLAVAMFLHVVDMAETKQLLGNWYAQLLPFLAMNAAHEISAAPGVILRPSVAVCCGFGLLTAAAFTFAASWSLRKNWGGYTTTLAERPQPRRILQIASRRVSAVSCSEHSNIVYQIEQSTHFGRSSGTGRWFFIMVLASCLSGGAFLWFVAVNKGESAFLDGCIAWFAMESFAFGILAPVLLANLFTKERESQSQDNLRMTLLSPFEVFSGKVRYAGSIVLRLLFAMAIGLVPVVMRFWRYPGSIGLTAMGLGTVAECLLLGTCLGIFASVIARRMTTALTLAYALTFTILAGGFFVLEIVYGAEHGIELGRIRNPTSQLFWINGFSPLMAYIECSEHPYGPILHMWLKSLVLHIGGALMLLALAYPIFRRRHVRDA